MSGGTFDYYQFHINEIEDKIKEHLDRQGKEIDYSNSYYAKSNLDPDTYPVYEKEVQDIFKDAVKILHLAAEYAHHIDYYLAGDIGEETLKERIREAKEKTNQP